MTEIELRQKVVDTASAWLGTREYSSKHQEMLDIYNAQRPLPRGTRMLSSWPWCAAFVSTVSLQCDLRDIMPTECGCPPMIRLYQDIGRWVEDDAYVPSPGDVIFYDWQDNGAGDNIGQSDHVGIVVGCTDYASKADSAEPQMGKRLNSLSAVTSFFPCLRGCCK